MSDIQTLECTLLEDDGDDEYVEINKDGNALTILPRIFFFILIFILVIIIGMFILHTIYGINKILR